MVGCNLYKRERDACTHVIHTQNNFGRIHKRLHLGSGWVMTSSDCLEISRAWCSCPSSFGSLCASWLLDLWSSLTSRCGGSRPAHLWWSSLPIGTIHNLPGERRAFPSKKRRKAFEHLWGLCTSILLEESLLLTALFSGFFVGLGSALKALLWSAPTSSNSCAKTSHYLSTYTPALCGFSPGFAAYPSVPQRPPLENGRILTAPTP